MGAHDVHKHDESCSCGLHDHSAHTHEHGESCSCGHTHEHAHDHVHTHEHAAEPELGAIRVESHLHDEARVISGLMTLVGDETRIKAALKEQLEMLAKAVFELGGIVGHIKASCETKTVEMFSVTDVSATSKTSPEKEIRINLAAIVFIVEMEQAESMVFNAMQTVKASA